MNTCVCVSIIGCPLKFSVSEKIVCLNNFDSFDTQNLLAPERVFTHPVLGNMKPENFEMDQGHVTKVFCKLLDNKKHF